MLFSELYSVYYNTVGKILKNAAQSNLSERELNEIVIENAFGESLLTIPAALKSEKWQLMTADMDTPLLSVLAMPLTKLEKMWLKAISLDPRIGLFEVDFADLSDVEPLFTPDSIYYYDRYADGDDYQDPEYVARFKTILNATKERQHLRIKSKTDDGKCMDVLAVPEHLEYSEKDDKFRLIVSNGKYTTTINLGRIVSCEIVSGQDVDCEQSCTENHSLVTFELRDGRNTLERAMLHFAHFEKRVEQISQNKYIVKIKYNLADQTEILIRILSFGPFIKVLEPDSFVELVRDRLGRQKQCGLK